MQNAQGTAQTITTACTFQNPFLSILTTSTNKITTKNHFVISV